MFLQTLIIHTEILELSDRLKSRQLTNDRSLELCGPTMSRPKQHGFFFHILPVSILKYPPYTNTNNCMLLSQKKFELTSVLVMQYSRCRPYKIASAFRFVRDRCIADEKFCSKRTSILRCRLYMRLDSAANKTKSSQHDILLA